MLTRRSLMTTTAAAVVAVAPTPALSIEPSMPLAPLVDAIKESVEIILREDFKPIPFLYSWLKNYSDLEPKILQELADVFAKVHREGRRVKDADGRLSLTTQFAIVDHFPWVPTSWPREAWDLAAHLVPAHMT